MILRRIAAHLRDQQWTAVGLDFLITVAGVFVGIQVSNLNAARLDRALEDQYTRRIQAELRIIVQTAERQREFERIKIEQLNAALQRIRAPASPDNKAQIQTLLTMLTLRLSPNFESATFSDLQNSGRLSLIRDARLRQQLSTYFGRLQYLKSAIFRNNDNYVETFADFLRSQSVSASFSDATTLTDVRLSPLDTEFAQLSRARFGGRQGGDGTFGMPASGPFWGQLRAQLSWRGNGAVANQWALDRIITDARQMQSEIESSAD